METQEKYSGLICLPILPSIYKQLPQRGKVLEKTPEAYKDGLLVHPAIPELMLDLEQRLSWKELEIVDCDSGFLWRQETSLERKFRILWEEPVHIPISLFKPEFSVPPKHYYLNEIEAREKKVADEKALRRLKDAEAASEAAAKAAAAQRAEAAALSEAKEKEAANAAHKAEEEAKEVAAAAADAMAGLVKLHGLQESALSARVIVEKLKQENADGEKKSHLLNLEWRLASLQARLQSLIDDTEAGKPLGELQILAGENLEDEIMIMGNEIAILRRAIQVLKGKDRGL